MNRKQLYTRAYWLAVFTIAYNILEGVFSVGLGFKDETFSLFGFGLDSFVEVLSGLGIWHMIKRIKTYGDEVPDKFERTALKVTGTAFYILSAGLVLTGIYGFFVSHKPETTFWGIIISLVSIATMWVLIIYKIKVGRALGSEAILADAECTRTCLILSVVLLGSSLGYELTGIGMIDSLGAIIIAVLAMREGKEAFEKARDGT
jgi:divalent metal cation (Fe/Co/Zn/Cd) transporter